MADVTSTARLIVEVIGEDKVKALARDLAALKKAGGSFAAGGVGARAGAKGALAELAGTRAGVKAGLVRAMAPVVAAQATAAKLSQQQAKSLLQAVSPAAAGALQAKLSQQQGRALLAALEPAIKAQTAAAVAAPKAIAAPIVSGIAEMTAAQRLAASIARRTGEKTAAVEARLAKGPQPFPLNAAEQKRRDANIAARAAGAAGAGPPKPPGAAAGLAEGAGVGVAARAGLAVGGITAAASLAAAGVVASIGIVLAAMKTGFSAAEKHAKDTIKLAGEAKRAGVTMDELQERRIAGERVLGEQYESIEKRLPKLLSTRNKQTRAALDSLGLSPKDLAQLEKAGKRFDPLDVIEKMQGKREALEDKALKAKAGKEKSAADKALRDFDDRLTRVLGKEAADKIAAGRAAETRQAKEDARRITAFGPKEAPAKQLADAKRMQREQDLIDRNSAAFTARIGSGMSESVGNVLETFRTKFQEVLGPGIADLTTNIGRLGFEGLKTALDALAPGAGSAATALQSLNTALEGLTFDQAVEKLKTNLGEGIRSAVDNAFKGMAADFSADSPFVKSVQENWKRFLDLFKLPDKKDADLTEAERVAKRDAELRQQTAAQDAAAAAARIRSEATEAAREARDKEIREQREAKPPPLEEKPKISLDEALKQIPSIGDLLKQSVDSIDLTGKGAALGDSIKTSVDSIDLSGKGAEAGNALGTAAGTGINAAGTSGGNAFSAAAGQGITSAGTAGGAAFASAINPSSIGSAIGAAAAAAISAATVNVNVNANVAGAAVGGARGGGASTGPDKASKPGGIGSA